jgi:small subunit ribosomal protein S16
VAVKIKLKRLGKIRAPYYRIVVADSRTKRDGRAIEEIGKYHPKAEPSLIEVNSERAQHWLSVGAQPTDPVRKILEVTGDWQKFKGLPGAEGTLKVAQPKADKKAVYAAAVAESLADSGAKAKPKGKTTGEAKAGGAKTDAKSGGTKAADTKSGGAKSPAAKADKASKPVRSKKASEAADTAGSGAAATEKAEAAEATPEAATEAPAEAAASEPAGDGA